MSTVVSGNSGGTAVTTTTPPAGSVLQVVNYQTGAVATGSTLIPFDDTVPQNTEGDEYMTLAITPKSATSRLVIDVLWQGSNSGAAGSTSQMSVALFQDSVASALASVLVSQFATSGVMLFPLTHSMISGTTSSTTFKVRAGMGFAGTTTFNGQSASRYSGGVLVSSITITEVAI